MEDTAKKFCSIIFDVLEEKGVKDVVCSPGSRNVPLLLAAAARDKMKKHFVIDERSAAFVGLGISLVSQRPVAVICTSGTALLDYAPAVAEAYYQGAPLIIISADRPVQWIDQDDSQTLRQDGALANYVKRSYSIPANGEDEKEMQWYVNRIVNDAFISANSNKKGPVHINIHLAEPLSHKCQRSNDTQRKIEVIEGDAIGNKETIKTLARELSESKTLLVAGFCLPDSSLQRAITEFSRFPNVVVMAETLSNLHLKEENYSIDSVLTAFPEEILDKYAPDIIISIGGALVSRKLKEYLRRNEGKCRHWSLGYSHISTDPFMSLSLRIETDPIRFLRNINSVLRKLKFSERSENYQSTWQKLRTEARKAKTKYIKSIGWSELKIFDFLLNHIPSEYNMFLSNGTAVRYAQIISYSLPHASYCNRGVSGIDGSISTAIGGSLEYKGRTLLITGDLSMAYDIGCLGIRKIPDRFKIIVIDNQGGGIFRFIPSTSGLKEREEYLCQPPLLPLRQLAKGYEWDYYECNDEDSLKSVYGEFLLNPRKSIMKISCDGFKSAEILKNYMTIKTTL